MKGKIELIGMEFHSKIGCLESEQADGNDMLVDLSFEYEIGPAASSDSLEDALNYAAVYEAVAREMQLPCQLLENAAARIALKLKEAFPQIERLSVCVKKKNPPLGGKVQWSSCSVEI